MNAPAGPADGTPLRFVLPERKKLIFEMVIPVRWGDMDAMGHVNNTVYFRYMEIVRLEWLHRVVGPPGEQGPVIINAFCNFLKQIEYPGDVLARHYVGGVGRSSFDTWMTLERTDRPGVVYAEGGARTVWTDYAAQKSVPLPAALRALLE
jgi:acyl-CoA thioester hydrolase